MNVRAVWSIYCFEMKRMWRTIAQSVASPVLSTCLYFIVFGNAIGSSIDNIDGIGYGAFIVPGLIMLAVLTQSVANASFGIYFPRFTGSIYEVLSAPISYFEVVLGYVGAASSKSIILGTLILGTSHFFVPISIQNPLMMVLFLVLTSIIFSLFGFIIGIWADSFDKLQLIPKCLDKIAKILTPSGRLRCVIPVKSPHFIMKWIQRLTFPINRALYNVQHDCKLETMINDHPSLVITAKKHLNKSMSILLLEGQVSSDSYDT